MQMQMQMQMQRKRTAMSRSVDKQDEEKAHFSMQEDRRTQNDAKVSPPVLSPIFLVLNLDFDLSCCCRIIILIM